MLSFSSSLSHILSVCRVFAFILTIASFCTQTLGDESAACTQTQGPTQALGLFKPGVAVPLDEGFRDPPAISRVQCWWQCHGSAFTKKEITRQLEQFSSWPKTFSFDYINDDVIQNHMTVRNGQIALDCGTTYQVLYIASSPDLKVPLATLDKLHEMVRQGATVVWAGKPPMTCPSLIGMPQADDQWRASVDELFGDGRLITLQQDDRFALIPIVEKSPNPPAWKMQNSQGAPLIESGLLGPVRIGTERSFSTPLPSSSQKD